MHALAGGIAQGAGASTASKVVDNWPKAIPVTEREIEVIETYLSDVLDAVLAQCRSGR
jgi:hypothetical protein